MNQHSAIVANNRGTGSVTATLQSTDFTAQAGTDLGNYVLPTSASGKVGLITPAALTVKVNNTAMFVTQDPNSAFDQGFSFDGLKNGESAANVLGTLTRSYTGAANPATGSYTAVYGLTATLVADNYTVTVQKGDLTVVAADKLLINVGGRSANYGALTAANAGASADSVVAQYCLVSTDCNGPNLASLTMNRQAGLWTATDVSNSTVRFNTVVDTAGRISGGGYLNAGNYTYAVDGLTTSGAVNFNGTVVSGGVLTVDAKLLALSASNVTKVYDGTRSLDGMALSPIGVLTGDTVGVYSTGGTFGSKNAGSQSFSLTGLQLQGSDRANYVFAGQSLSGIGTITPKTLSVLATASDKVYDGTTTASVQVGRLIGLVDDEQLQMQATGSFGTPEVGVNKPVAVRYNLSNGANGGLSSNYDLPGQQLSASIYAKSGGNVVQPIVIPTSAVKATSMVKTIAALGLGSVSGAATSAATATLNQPDTPDVCSVATPESCECVQTSLAGVDICYPGFLKP